MEIEIEDWLYQELEHRKKVLGYNSINELLVDYIIRRAPPIALERQAVKGIHELIKSMKLDEELPIDVAIDEVAFRAATKYGYLITSVSKLEGTILELLVVKFLEEEGLDFVYKAPQVGYGYSKGILNASNQFGLPDISFGLNGKLIGVIEVKKQEVFRMTYYDKLKLSYYIKKGLQAHLITTAPLPQRSKFYTELVDAGIAIHHVHIIKNLREAVKLVREKAITSTKC